MGAQESVPSSSRHPTSRPRNADSLFPHHHYASLLEPSPEMDNFFLLDDAHGHIPLRSIQSQRPVRRIPIRDPHELPNGFLSVDFEDDNEAQASFSSSRDVSSVPHGDSLPHDSDDASVARRLQLMEMMSSDHLQETHPNILRFLSDAGVSFDNSAESEDVERILREELRNAERRAAQEQEDHALALRLSQEVENVREVSPLDLDHPNSNIPPPSGRPHISDIIRQLMVSHGDPFQRSRHVDVTQEMLDRFPTYTYHPQDKISSSSEDKVVGKQPDAEDDSSSNQCAICQCEFEDGEDVKVLSCLHRFHTECVDDWLRRGKVECPVCKFDLASDMSDGSEQHVEPFAPPLAQDGRGAADGGLLDILSFLEGNLSVFVPHSNRRRFPASRRSHPF